MHGCAPFEDWNGCTTAPTLLNSNHVGIPRPVYVPPIEDLVDPVAKCVKTLPALREHHVTEPVAPDLEACGRKATLDHGLSCDLYPWKVETLTLRLSNFMSDEHLECRDGMGVVSLTRKEDHVRLVFTSDCSLYGHTCNRIGDLLINYDFPAHATFPNEDPRGRFSVQPLLDGFCQLMLGHVMENRFRRGAGAVSPMGEMRAHNVSRPVYQLLVARRAEIISVPMCLSRTYGYPIGAIRERDRQLRSPSVLESLQHVIHDDSWLLVATPCLSSSGLPEQPQDILLRYTYALCQSFSTEASVSLGRAIWRWRRSSDIRSVEGGPTGD